MLISYIRESEVVYNAGIGGLMYAPVSLLYTRLYRYWGTNVCSVNLSCKYMKLEHCVWLCSHCGGYYVQVSMELQLILVTT